MRMLYIGIIAVSVFFNTMTQSIAFDAIRTGIPFSCMIQAKGNVTDALFLLSLKELGEVRVS